MRSIGPIVIAPVGNEQQVETVSLKQSKELCREQLDWIEVVNPLPGSGSPQPQHT